MDISLTDVNQSDITLELSGRTIVINEALTRGCAGRLNFTIAHEIAHHIIDIVCGANYSVKFRLLPHFENLVTEDEVAKIKKSLSEHYGAYSVEIERLGRRN